MAPDHSLVFIKNKRNDYLQRYGSDFLAVYKDFYAQIASEGLTEIFAIFHYQLNALFRSLNGRLENKHYLADESRELLYVIEEITLVKANLKNTQHAFDIDEEYSVSIKKCGDFLQNSGGSRIPDDFKKIALIEAAPIFTPKNSVRTDGKNGNRTFELKIVGKGSYATVFKYKDEFYNRQFALKRANKDLNSKEIERFEREFETMKRLNSPYVIEVYSFDKNRLEYTMEFAEETLQTHVNRSNSRITMAERINLVRQVLRAFKYINGKEVLHRDISTTNILLKKYEGLIVVKVSDFGLVKERNSELTSTNTEIKGSLNDPKLDLVGFQNYSLCHETYALTRLIYFIMTGKNTMDLAGKTKLSNFSKKGISDNLDERYQNVEKLGMAFEEMAKLSET